MTIDRKDWTRQVQMGLQEEHDLDQIMGKLLNFTSSRLSLHETRNEMSKQKPCNIRNSHTNLNLMADKFVNLH